MIKEIQAVCDEMPKRLMIKACRDFFHQHH